MLNVRQTRPGDMQTSQIEIETLTLCIRLIFFHVIFRVVPLNMVINNILLYYYYLHPSKLRLT